MNTPTHWIARLAALPAALLGLWMALFAGLPTAGARPPVAPARGFPGRG